VSPPPGNPCVEHTIHAACPIAGPMRWRCEKVGCVIAGSCEPCCFIGRRADERFVVGRTRAAIRCMNRHADRSLILAPANSASDPSRFRARLVYGMPAYTPIMCLLSWPVYNTLVLVVGQTVFPMRAHPCNAHGIASPRSQSRSGKKRVTSPALRVDSQQHCPTCDSLGQANCHPLRHGVAGHGFQCICERCSLSPQRTSH
jgi:hypothetical protein